MSEVEHDIRAEQLIEQLLGALGRQGIEPELAVVGFATPRVLVLGTVVDKEQKARGRQAVHEAVEEGLRLAVDPVQVLEDQKKRLFARFPQQHPPDRVEDALPSLAGIERLPRGIVHGHVEQG